MCTLRLGVVHRAKTGLAYRTHTAKPRAPTADTLIGIAEHNAGIPHLPAANIICCAPLRHRAHKSGGGHTHRDSQRSLLRCERLGGELPAHAMGSAQQPASGAHDWIRASSEDATECSRRISFSPRHRRCESRK